MRPIDADSMESFLLDQMRKETGSYAKGVNAGIRVARSAIKNKQISPTIDAVPVVRCRACKNYEPCKLPYDGYCTKWYRIVGSGFFCKDGERLEVKDDVPK